MSLERVKVECYSGYKYAQEPRAFLWQGERHIVQTVQQSWLTPEGLCFRVKTEEGQLFQLSYRDHDDQWFILSETGTGQTTRG